MKIRKATQTDRESIFQLYQRVACTTIGLIRSADEITKEYIADFIQKSIDTGIGLVAEDQNGKLIAEIHTYPMGIRAFDHILANLTCVVHPDEQGKGIGKQIFQNLLEEIKRHHPDIGRVELIARESNTKAITLYEKLGFKKEGRLEKRIRHSTNSFEADIMMAWFNPNYKFNC